MSVAGELDALRIAVAETEALAAVTAESHDRQDWDDADPLHVERLASLLGLIARSASGAVAAFHRLHGAVADAQPAPAGEVWDHEGKGKAPGEGEQDAAIVQRLRSESPDGRFEGSSDEELLELFRRNKRVLDRTDEDVIAAMVRPR